MTPAEIIAKKIFYRADSFKPRDIFDLAAAYYYGRNELIDSLLPQITNMLDILEARINSFDETDIRAVFQDLDVLDGGKAIAGNELELCRDFLASAREKTR